MVWRMDQVEAPPLPPPSPWPSRLRALFEVLVLSGLVSSFIAALPFALIAGVNLEVTSDARLMAGFLMSDAAVTFLLLLLLFLASGEEPAAMGLRFGGRWAREALLGAAVVPLLFAMSFLFAAIFQTLLPQHFLEHNPLTEAIRTPGDLALMVLSGLIVGGLKEEMQRAFIITRFRYLGGVRLGLVLWSVGFGLGHYMQGPQGMVAATVFGLIFGSVYLSRGSLIAPMVAHGAYNTLAVLAYWIGRNAGA